MNKDKINSKIEDLEAELQKLKQLANEPKQRTPEAGDVWEDSQGYGELIAKSGQGVDLISGYISLKKYNQYPTNSSDTYLGKHHEVYVKISDVRAALSYEDFFGNSVLDSPNSEIFVSKTGSSKTLEALRKLNIITD